MIRKSLLTLLVVTIWLVAVTAHAGTPVDVKHRFISAETVGAESLVTLEMTIANTGTAGLSDVTLIAIGPVLISSSSSHALNAGPLSGGETTVQTWSLPTAPSEQMAAIFSGDLYLSVKAVDESGTATFSEATSQGGY